MPLSSNIRPGLMLMLMGLTGCAAPIKALMGEPVPMVDQASVKAASEEEERLRLALMAKGQALLRARGQQSADAPSVAQGVPPEKVSLGATSAPRGPTPAVSAMLARARIAEAPRPTSSLRLHPSRTSPAPSA